MGRRDMKFNQYRYRIWKDRNTSSNYVCVRKKHRATCPEDRMKHRAFADTPWTLRPYRDFGQNKTPRHVPLRRNETPRICPTHCGPSAPIGTCVRIKHRATCLSVQKKHRATCLSVRIKHRPGCLRHSWVSAPNGERKYKIDSIKIWILKRIEISDHGLCLCQNKTPRRMPETQLSLRP